MKCFWNAIILVFLLLDIRIFPNLLHILLYVSSCNRWVEGLLAFQECDILHTIILIQVIYKLWMFHNFLNFLFEKAWYDSQNIFIQNNCYEFYIWSRIAIQLIFYFHPTIRFLEFLDPSFVSSYWGITKRLVTPCKNVDKINVQKSVCISICVSPPWGKNVSS